MKNLLLLGLFVIIVGLAVGLYRKSRSKRNTWAALKEEEEKSLWKW